jgi:hypothetical protein
MGGHALHCALDIVNYCHYIETLWLPLQTTQVLQSLMELYANYWILIIIRKLPNTCLLIRWRPPIDRTSEGCVLHYKLKVQQLIMFWND